MEKCYGKIDIFRGSFRFCAKGDYVWEKLGTGDILTVIMSRQ